MMVSAGQLAALIGHNGAGKSTLLKAIFGLLPVWSGQITFDGKTLKSTRPLELLSSGMAYIPQGNRVFSDLTVKENLEMGGVTLSDARLLAEGVDRALLTFPALKERLRRRAATLSGGERQMLALANALVLSPRLLLLDEPSLGLAPPLVKEALERIQQLNREKGITIVIVEQKVREVLAICDRVFCLKLGALTFAGSPEELGQDPSKLRQAFL
jgi:branched-chain amino acid transport system ATP-binding protein